MREGVEGQGCEADAPGSFALSARRAGRTAARSQHTTAGKQVLAGRQSIEGCRASGAANRL